ncbi:hypothetical protein AB1Y20_021541 [Prymnesium parvum]|uniref:NADP-dependent oxidoreductase domain-containing protein n=1 Tax=Prymnesium parvum TaxID=97485 RepID=A0AB34JLT7_PRYPA
MARVLRGLPRLYLGTMTFGWSHASSAVDGGVAAAMVEKFVQSGGAHVDSARIYAAGQTEPLVGAACRPFRAALALGSKAHPSQAGGLSAEGMRAQLAASLEALGADSLDEFYLHQPDPGAPLLESLQCADALLREGRVRAVGMSNYHASEMARAFSLCEAHGLQKPSVYQGLYNPLNRMVEAELLPLLRQHGCSFVAYNPLAAGLLTGAHKREGEVLPGRFKDNPNYLPRFYTSPNFIALENIRSTCEAAGLSLVQATYQWLLRHSALNESDGPLIGASSLSQLEENLDACRAAATAKPLPTAVHAAMEGAWSITRKNAFDYWRSYSSDMPNRANLPQGASYSAAK